MVMYNLNHGLEALENLYITQCQTTSLPHLQMPRSRRHLKIEETVKAKVQK